MSRSQGGFTRRSRPAPASRHARCGETKPPPAVHGFARDGDGSLLAAGYFEWAGRRRVGPLARLDEQGQWEPAGEGLPASDLSAVAVRVDGRLAVSTNVPLLPVFPPQPQGGEILVDVGDGTWRPIGAFQGIVRALAWVGESLWVGGTFELSEGGPSGLARWHEGAWSEPPGGAVDGPVYTLLVEDDSLLVGGSFTEVGGTSARSVAEWRAGSWRALDMHLEPSAPAGVFRGPIVFGLARDEDDTLFAGGAFYDADDPTVGGVAQWNGTEWTIVGSGLAQYGGVSGDLPPVVSDLAVYRGLLYAGGCFTRTGGDPTDATSLPGIARWTGTSWELPPGTGSGPIGDPWFHSGVCGAEPSGTAILETEIQRLYSDGTRLFVGGSLPGIGGVASKSIIAYDGRRWAPPTNAIGLGLAGSADELAVGDPQCRVYAFGGFTHAGRASGARVYRFDGDRWTAIAADIPQGVTCTQLAVSHAGDLSAQFPEVVESLFTEWESYMTRVGGVESSRPMVYY